MTMITEKEMRQRQMKAREERRRKVRRNRRILAGVIAIIIGLILGSISIHIKNAQADSEEVVLEDRKADLPILVEYVHEVKGGENLTYIAKKYIDEYNSNDSVETVVSRIMWYNNLDATESTYHLQPGDKLIVPIFIPADRNPYHAEPENKESQN